MKRSKKYLIKLLDETVNYYKTHQRSVDEGGHCLYYNSDNNAMCAVGRCLTEPKEIDKLFEDVDDSTVYDLLNFKTDDIFKDKYKNVPVNIWTLLQDLHDLESHWIVTTHGNKLSTRGLERYNRIKDDINLMSL